MRAGEYAYRFSGYAMQSGDQCHLVGVGTVTLDGKKITKGQHRTYLTTLEGFDPQAQTGHFKLSGSYGPKDGDEHDVEATITFTSVDLDAAGNSKQVLTGTFSLVPAGSADGYWMISTGAHNDTINERAVEVVSGELIRIGDVKAPA
ncbi:MAG: hypothetical protein ABL871_06905 [Terricaulis sp.]